MDMGDGMPEEVFHMPATPEDIKLFHGKCGTCSFYGLNHTPPWNECLNPESPYFARHDGMIDKGKDYCRFHEDYYRNHHEPKEGKNDGIQH
jgi:hypothetical protein